MMKTRRRGFLGGLLAALAVGFHGKQAPKALAGKTANVAPFLRGDSVWSDVTADPAFTAWFNPIAKYDQIGSRDPLSALGATRHEDLHVIYTGPVGCCRMD